MALTKKRIARFVDVKPLFVSLVGRPASRKFWTDVVRAADLEEHERAGGVAIRSGDPEVAELLVALRNDQAGERARRVTFEVVRVDKERHIVYGAAYCPALDAENGDTISRDDFNAKVDTYGTFMDSATLMDLAHAYMEECRAVDVDHSMKATDAVPVESVFLREGEQTEDYPHPNTWKLGVKIRDKKAWKRVEKGELKAFSIAVVASFESIDVWVEDGETDNTQTATAAERGEQGMSTVVKRSVVAFQDWPLADKGVAWDASAAAKRCQEVCSSDGTGDQGTVDLDEYARCFLRSVDGDSLDAYDLGVVDVVDGDRKVVPAALDVVAARLDQTDLSDDEKAAVRTHLEAYYKKAGEEAPWNRSAPAPVPAPAPEVPPAPPAPPATRAESKFTTHLTDMLAKSEANARVWYALYALEDIVGACVWENAYDCCGSEGPTHTLEDVAQAFDDAKPFVLQAIADLIALEHAEQRADLTDDQRAEAKRAALDKMLATRRQIAERKGRVLSQANYEKLSSCHGLLREVLDAAEASDAAANPVTDNDGKPTGEGGEVVEEGAPGAPGTPAPLPTQTRDDLVARMDAMQKRLDDAEAELRAVNAQRLDSLDTVVRETQAQVARAEQTATGLVSRLDAADLLVKRLDADVAAVMDDLGIQRSEEGRPGAAPEVTTPAAQRRQSSTEARRSLGRLLVGGTKG